VGKSGSGSLFLAVGLDANAASLGDVIVQIGLADPDRACEPVSYEVAANDGPSDRIMTEL
jgi:hypothetical protein